MMMLARARWITRPDGDNWLVGLSRSPLPTIAYPGVEAGPLALFFSKPLRMVSNVASLI